MIRSSVGREGTAIESLPDYDDTSLDRRERRALLGMFLLVFAVYAFTSGGHAYSIDEEIMYQTTRSLARVQASVDVTDPNFPHLYHQRPDGSWAGIYGIGQSLAALPLHLTARGASHLLPEHGRDVMVRTVTFLTNSVLTSLTTIVIVIVARRFTSSFRRAAALGLVFALGTYAWPHAKTFFAEPGTALCVLLGVFWAIHWYRHSASHYLVKCGAALGAAMLFRPSAGILVATVVVVLGVTAITRGGVHGALAVGGWWTLGFLGPALVVLATNWWRFGSPFELAYPSYRQDYPVVQGIWNQLASPGKGVILYAPIVAVGLVALPLAARKFPWETTLLVTVAGANLVLFGRVPFWAGDAAWGPRYVQIVLPCLVLLAAPMLASDRWWRATRVAGVIGLVPALVGVLVYFNVFYLRAEQAIGSERIADKGGLPRHLVHIHESLRWNPIWGHVRLLPDAVHDVIKDGDSRGTYSEDPTTHYGYFSRVPRIDTWWLWVGPTNGSQVTYLLLLPIAASACRGARLLRASSQRQSPCRQGARTVQESRR